MTVAVVIPAYVTADNNRSDMLKAAIRSVELQSAPGVVPIVIDDESPASLDYLRTPEYANVRYIRRKKGSDEAKGPSGAVNHGIDLLLDNPAELLSSDEASGLSAVCYLHSDDLLPRNSVSDRLSALANSFVYGKLARFSGRRYVGIRQFDLEIFSSAMFHFPHPSVMWNVDFLRALREHRREEHGHGVFDPVISFDEDRDASIASFEFAQVSGLEPTVVDSIVYAYREHQLSISADQSFSLQARMSQRDRVKAKYKNSGVFEGRDDLSRRNIEKYDSLRWRIRKSIPRSWKAPLRLIRQRSAKQDIRRQLGHGAFSQLEKLIQLSHG